MKERPFPLPQQNSGMGRGSWKKKGKKDKEIKANDKEEVEFFLSFLTAGGGGFLFRLITWHQKERKK